jgi:cytochrome c oxidase subunit 3
VLDVRGLPSYAFGQGSLMWWSTMGLMLIEGTVFAIGVMMYFYLRGVAAAWPIDAAPPGAALGHAQHGHPAAEPVAQSDGQARRRAAGPCTHAAWLAVCVVFAVVFLAVRALEFTTLNVSWHVNAYGSVVWLLLGLHTTHLITDTIDTAVLAVLLFTGPFEGKRFVDVSENALYWYFVVGSWLPIYAVIYLAPLA